MKQLQMNSENRTQWEYGIRSDEKGVWLCPILESSHGGKDTKIVLKEGQSQWQKIFFF